MDIDIDYLNKLAEHIVIRTIFNLDEDKSKL